MTNLELFIKNNKNWKEILTEDPYHIIIKETDNYTLLRYNQLDSDFHQIMTREARGIIFDKDMNVVCHPYNKFFNYGESYADTIDWDSAVVMEKIDGSLMKAWNDGKWHLSTNNVINAYEAVRDDDGKTFGVMFEEALGCSMDTFYRSLDPSYTYMFELVHPKSQLVVVYERPAVYFTGVRNAKTDMEEKMEDHLLPAGTIRPGIYPLTNLNAVKNLVKGMDASHEGVVVRDDDFHRIKIKAEEYLIRAHLIGNATLTDKRIIKMMQDGTIDDFLAYFPNKKDRVEEVISLMRSYLNRMDLFYYANRDLDKKSFAIKVKKEDLDLGYLMCRYLGITDGSMQYFMDATLNTVLRILRNERK